MVLSGKITSSFLIQDADGRAQLAYLVNITNSADAIAGLTSVFTDRVAATAVVAAAAEGGPSGHAEGGDAGDGVYDSTHIRGAEHIQAKKYLEAFDAFAAVEPPTAASLGLHALCMLLLDEV